MGPKCNRYKVKLMIFVPVLAFKRRFEVCFVMFKVN